MTGEKELVALSSTVPNVPGKNRQYELPSLDHHYNGLRVSFGQEDSEGGKAVPVTLAVYDEAVSYLRRYDMPIVPCPVVGSADHHALMAQIGRYVQRFERVGIRTIWTNKEVIKRGPGPWRDGFVSPSDVETCQFEEHATAKLFKDEQFAPRLTQRLSARLAIADRFKIIRQNCVLAKQATRGFFESHVAVNMTEIEGVHFIKADIPFHKEVCEERSIDVPPAEVRIGQPPNGWMLTTPNAVSELLRLALTATIVRDLGIVAQDAGVPDEFADLPALVGGPRPLGPDVIEGIVEHLERRVEEIDAQRFAHPRDMERMAAERAALVALSNQVGYLGVEDVDEYCLYHMDRDFVDGRYSDCRIHVATEGDFNVESFSQSLGLVMASAVRGPGGRRIFRLIGNGSRLLYRDEILTHWDLRRDSLVEDEDYQDYVPAIFAGLAEMREMEYELTRSLASFVVNPYIREDRMTMISLTIPRTLRWGDDEMELDESDEEVPDLEESAPAVFVPVVEITNEKEPEMERGYGLYVCREPSREGDGWSSERIFPLRLLTRGQGIPIGTPSRRLTRDESKEYFEVVRDGHPYHIRERGVPEDGREIGPVWFEEFSLGDSEPDFSEEESPRDRYAMSGEEEDITDATFAEPERDLANATYDVSRGVVSSIMQRALEELGEERALSGWERASRMAEMIALRGRSNDADREDRPDEGPL